jgi:hypothetical protein
VDDKDYFSIYHVIRVAFAGLVIVRVGRFLLEYRPRKPRRLQDRLNSNHDVLSLSNRLFVLYENFS